MDVHGNPVLCGQVRQEDGRLPRVRVHDMREMVEVRVGGRQDLVGYNQELVGLHNYLQGGRFLQECLHYEVGDTPLILQV